MLHDQVLKRNGAVRKKISISSMFLGYTTFMRGVDVVDQSRAFYFFQS